MQTDQAVIPASFSNADEVQRWAIGAILKFGSSTSPRGMGTLELSPLTFTLSNPRRRCIEQPERKWSRALAIGEFLWHAAASDDAATLEYYARPWAAFAVDGRILGSCYGKSIFGRACGYESQWQRVISLLKTDPDSRRAVLDFRASGANMSFDAPDIACVSSLQFLVRDGKLNALAVLRSNDVIWGLPYDLFVLTMFQEMAAQELGTEIGWYNHHAASMHIYERHINLAENILAGAMSPSREMQRMGDLSELPNVIAAEREIRKGLRPDLKNVSSTFWREMIGVLMDFQRRKGT
jgi:thymidylate synthase